MLVFLQKYRYDITVVAVFVLLGVDWDYTLGFM